MRALLEGASPSSSISEDPDLTSEMGDPLHDESILQELFYTNEVRISSQALVLQMMWFLALSMTCCSLAGHVSYLLGLLT
jgi:hypothetical protein